MTSTSAVKTFLFLFYLLSPFLHISCLKCDGTGNNPPDCNCAKNQFEQSRQGAISCQRCTETCDRSGNQIEVVPCSRKQNRHCFCKAGFYCKEENNYKTYCHKECDPCGPGTFSSQPSLSKRCMPHKDCAKLGMIVLTEGTATQDRECVSVTTKMSSTHLITNTTSSLNTITTESSDNIAASFSNRIASGFSDTITTSSSETITTSSLETITTSSSETITTSSSETITTSSSANIANGYSDNINTSSSSLITSGSSSTSRSSNTITTGSSKVTNRRSVQMSTTTSSDDSNSTPVNNKGGTTSKQLPKEHRSLWLLLFILLVVFMAGFCMLIRKAEKTLSKCYGFICEKHGNRDQHKQTAGHIFLSNHCTEPEVPLGSDVREVKGQNLGAAPQSGGVQQVTMGKGENVSNTVGSIYIYSPGMVILGSNSGDKKEEAGACEEEIPLISKPQQESNPPSQEVRIRMSAQEEDELSLRFPVPATGK